MSDLKAQFDEAVSFVQSGESGFKPDNALKLKMYALYKQATDGDVSGKRPGMMKVVERAKWDAWAALQGTSAETAMTQYISEVDALRA